MPTPETRDAALLPCPRCGSPVSAHAGAFGDWWDIQCTAENCRLHLPDAGETEAQAIAAWNRRTPDTPDARPVGETLGSAVLESVRRREDLLDVIADEAPNIRGSNVDLTATWVAIETALAAYHDAVAAEARAALLAGAPTVWAATDDDGSSYLFHEEPEKRGDLWRARFADVSMYLGDNLTPPGTVRRYALVPIEEETPNGNA